MSPEKEDKVTLVPTKSQLYKIANCLLTLLPSSVKINSNPDYCRPGGKDEPSKVESGIKSETLKEESTSSEQLRQVDTNIEHPSKPPAAPRRKKK